MEKKKKPIRFLPSSVEAMVSMDTLKHVEPILGETVKDSDEKYEKLVQEYEEGERIREIPDDYYPGY